MVGLVGVMTAGFPWFCRCGEYGSSEARSNRVYGREGEVSLDYSDCRR